MAERCLVRDPAGLRPKWVRGEMFLTTGSADKIEARAKEPGRRGLASKVRVARSGNSLGHRDPTSLPRHLKLRSGQEVLLAPDPKSRLDLA